MDKSDRSSSSPRVLSHMPIPFASLLFAIALPAQAQDSPPRTLAEPTESASDHGGDRSWEAGWEVLGTSAYVWRGIRLGDLSIQPYAEFNWNSLSLSVFSNLDFKSRKANDNECMLGGTLFDMPLNDLVSMSLAANAAYYHYPTEGGDTAEIALIYGFAFGEVASTSLTYSQDVILHQGAYLSLALADFRPFWYLADTVDIPFQVGVSAGLGSKRHNNEYYGDNKTGVADVAVAAKIPIQWGLFFLAPNAGYAKGLMGDKESNAWGGAALGVWY
jgi:hypothetical protein